MTTIVGIDYSGARDDRNTWVARGQVISDGVLRLESAEMTPRQEVTDLLTSVRRTTVAGIDFPFGLPRHFAEFLTTRPLVTMLDLWRAMSDLSLSDFISARDAYVRRFGEPKRAGDEAHFKESYSPLHKVNPNMLPMTYYGIRMLREVQWKNPENCVVPPVPTLDIDMGQSLTVLETMPGAFLRSIGTIYKGYKKPQSTQLRDERRIKILDALENRAGVKILNLSQFRQECLASDDCLDSIIAAITAARWALDPSTFRHPDSSEFRAASLEGWIYVPKSQSAE